jgi:hypothetical protein
MKIIKYLSEQIMEELEDAEKYAKAALYNKHTDTELSRMYAELSRQELNHSDMLHTQAVRLIKAEREKGVEPPAAMLAVWDWQHDKMIDHTAKVKHLLSGM